MTKKIKLYCIPYAGGSAVLYSKWKNLLPDWLELRPLELAGRGVRINEPFYADVNEAVNDLFSMVRDEIETSEYVIFGHSMGAMLCYELAQKISRESTNQPLHLFFSGRTAPHIAVSEEKKYHLLDADEFKRKVKSLGGTPPEFFDHPELMELFLPLLRNDFRLASTDNMLDQINPFDSKISVLLGKEEDMTAKQAHEWRFHSLDRCTLYYFNGGHFFINDHFTEIVELIQNVLQSSSAHQIACKAQ